MYNDQNHQFPSLSSNDLEGTASQVAEEAGGALDFGWRSGSPLIGRHPDPELAEGGRTYVFAARCIGRVARATVSVEVQLQKIAAIQGIHLTKNLR
jgi:hypothetical protein